MHALVTGASGFLGGRLVTMLLAQGIEVSILARASSQISPWPGVQVVRADVRELGPVLLRDVTHVFHCAGCSTDWARRSTYEESNVTSVGILLTKLMQHATRLERLLHVSTTDVYGYPAVAGDESLPRRDTGLPYNSSKLRGEDSVWLAGREGLPVTVVRPASIYGPHGKAFVTDIVALLRQRLMLLVDGGRAPGGFVYVDDVCTGMLLAATMPAGAGEAYNLSSTDGTTWSTYTRALAAALGLPAPWLQLPFGAAMALATVSELPHMAGIPGRPLLTRHAVHLLARDQQYGTAKAMHELGWVPRTTLSEGIAHSAAWIKDQRSGG